MTEIYVGTFDKNVPGLRFIDRSGEGFLDITYGLGFDPVPPRVYDCGPYTLTITKNGAPFQTITRPNHFYESSWWIDLVPVTSASVIRDPAALIANDLVPPFGKTAVPVTLPAPGSVIFPGPMKLTPNEPGYEPTTGGRGAIGIVTDVVAGWLLTGDFRNASEDAKNVATQPIWAYDNGKPIDLIAKPKTTHYSSPAQGGAPIWLGPFPDPPADPTAALQLSYPQTAHMEELCGVVALATGAPRYIRALQMRVVRGFDEDNYAVGEFGAATVFHNEMRGIAWLLRQLFYCYWATFLAEQAGTLPTNCLPSSTFKTIIDNQAAQFTKFIEPDPFFQVFGVWGGSNNAWWQDDMVTQVLCLYAGKWPAVWGPILIKTFKNLAARVNADGKNQWPIASPCWYWGWLGENGVPYSGFRELWQKWSTGQATGTDLSGNNGWLTAAQVAALNADPTNGLNYIRPTEYESWALGALAFVVYLDRGKLAGAISAVYPNLEQAYAQQMAMMAKWVNTAGGYFLAQCSISVTPQPIHALPSDPPPPTGEPPMADNPLSALATAVHAASDATTKVHAAVQHVLDRFAALAAAATASGTQIDPAAVAALTTELQADVATLTTDAGKAQAT